MTKEQLDALLASGEITQEEYDVKLAELEAGGGGGGEEPKTQQQQFEEFTQSAAFQELLRKAAQSEADRVRTQATKEKKALEAELAALRAAQMTEEERAQAALEAERKALEEERAELHRVKMDAHATNVLVEKKMPFEFKEFIVGQNEQDTTNRATKLADIMKKSIDAEVERRVEEEFKKHNYIPGGATRSSSKVNPFARETQNLTEQAKLFRENPDEARRLAAAAGIKLQ